MKNLTYKFLVRGKNDEHVTVYLRIIIERKVKYYTLKISGKKRDWNPKKQLFRKTDYRNMIITKYRNEIDKYILHCSLNNKHPNFEDIARLMQRKAKDYDFYSFVEEQLQKRKHEYSEQTFKTYYTYLTKLKAFKKEVLFHQIDEDFVLSYKKYMIHIRKNNKNTVNKSLSILRTFVLMAKKAGYIHHNPFENIKIGSIEGKRDFLSIEELQLLEKYYRETSNRSHKRILRYFLFSCYTGLRFSDVVNLQYENIQNGIIEIKMHKTKDYVRIPLSSKAKALIPENENSGKIFDTITNQKTNAMLKKIMQQTGIQKHVSFHVARHTFATISLTIGIPIEVVQKLLGHHDIRETLIYAKIVDTLKQKEMEKWDNL